MSDKEFTVKVPVYGYIEMDVPAESVEEAKSIAFEDCKNILVDTSGMEYGAGVLLVVLP